MHQKDTTIIFDHTLAGIVAERRKSRKLLVRHHLQTRTNQVAFRP
jgi:hypothetical protein